MAVINPDLKAAISWIFHDATVTQDNTSIVMIRRVEMNQNIEYMLDMEASKLLSRIIKEADAVQIQCEDLDEVGKFRITFLLPGNLGKSEIVQIKAHKIRTVEEYQQEVENQKRMVFEALGMNERESYRPSVDFDPQDEESVRLEALQAFDWMDNQAEKRMNVDFAKWKTSRELAKLVEETNFGVFDEKSVRNPEPDEDHASMFVVFRREFEDLGFFLWNLTGDLKDRFADMLRLSDGMDITVGFYDDEKSIEILLGVDDVYIGEITE